MFTVLFMTQMTHSNSYLCISGGKVVIADMQVKVEPREPSAQITQIYRPFLCNHLSSYIGIISE